MARSTEESENEPLLVTICREQLPERCRPRPRIQKVPCTLRKVEENATCFDPQVVSLGPYHHFKPKDSLKVKDKAVQWFVSFRPGVYSPDKVGKIYKEFVSEASRCTSLRDFYVADDTIKELKDDEFNSMMFRDGCFILYIVAAAKRTDESNPHDDPYLPFFASDMLSLENQIPYAVLKSLMSLMPPHPKPVMKDDIEDFIQEFFIPEYGTLKKPSTFDQIHTTNSQLLRTSGDHDPSTSNYEPLHLIDILKTKLVGGSIDFSETCDAYYFRSITELKAIGIKLHKSQSNILSEINYHEGLIFGHLSLPQIIVKDFTKNWLLNLIAYELCSGFPSESDAVITSYVCLLNCLIDSPDDVKELRSNNILLNRLGSDEDVAKLFNEVGKHLTRNHKVFAKTLTAIRVHRDNQFKVRFAEMLYTYFSSPWSAISLAAAVLLLVLTLVQTYYTIW